MGVYHIIYIYIYIRIVICSIDCRPKDPSNFLRNCLGYIRYV